MASPQCGTLSAACSAYLQIRLVRHDNFSTTAGSFPSRCRAATLAAWCSGVTCPTRTSLRSSATPPSWPHTLPSRSPGWWPPPGAPSPSTQVCVPQVMCEGWWGSECVCGGGVVCGWGGSVWVGGWVGEQCLQIRNTASNCWPLSTLGGAAARSHTTCLRAPLQPVLTTCCPILK